MNFTQVDTFTLTSAANTVTIGGGTGGSSSTNFAINTDDVYALFYRDVYMTNDGAVSAVRLTKSGDGTAVTSSNYDNARMNIYANQAHYDAANQNSTSFPMIGCGTTSQESQQGLFWLYNFNSSSLFSQVNWHQQVTTETPEYIGPAGGGTLDLDETHDGVQFFANSGNIANGTWTLYKIGS